MTDNMPGQRHMAPFHLRRRVGAHHWTNTKHVMRGAPRERMKVEEWMPALAGEEVSALIDGVQEIPRKRGAAK